MSQDYLDKLIEKDKAGTQIQSIPLHDTELRGITIDDPITVEGNPINFSTKNEQNAIQTVVNLEPIQDLHGYSKPWVGGAGKNKLPLLLADLKALNTSGTWSGNAYTLNNVTFTILTDADNNVIGIKVNGTANANNTTFLFLDNVENPFNGMIINGCPSGGTSSSYRIRFAKKDASNVNKGEVYDYGSGATITDNYPKCSVLIDIFNNYAIPTGGLTFYPMLRLSTVTDPTFEPYENICPILPHEEIKIGGCGKNLFGYGVNVVDKTSEYRANPSQRLIIMDSDINSLTMRFNNGTWSTVLLEIDNIDTTQDYILSFKIKDNNSGYTPYYAGKDTTYSTDTKLVLAIGGGNGNTVAPTTSHFTLYDIQLEEGSSPTDYEPYTLSNQLTLPLPEDVYGGTLNLETGEMVVDWKNIDLGTLDWNYNSQMSRHTFEAVINGRLYDSNRYRMILPQYTYYNDSPNSMPDKSYTCSNNSNVLYIKDDDKIDSGVANFKQLLSGSIAVYELSTPYTLHLTPAQLKLFKDINNLNSSDYTTLTVTYHSNSIATLTPATDTTDGLLTAMDKRALDRTEEIVEGNPIQFETESTQVAKSTIVDLEPIQDLHGYSKPWVGGAGKNKCIPKVTSNTSLNGIVVNVNKDSDGNIIGYSIPSNTATGNVNIVFGEFTPNADGDYILSGCQLNQSTTDVYTFLWDETTSKSAGKITSSAVTVTLTANHQYLVALLVNNGNSVTSSELKPMIRLSSVSDATFEPYTNICSISGYDNIDINGYWKNLLNPDTFIQGLINYINGEVQGSTSWITSDYIECQGTVTLQGWKDGTEGNFCVRFCEYASDKSFIKNTNNVNTSDVITYSKIITLDSNTRYIRASFGFDNKTTTIPAFFTTNRLMLELGSQATPYEPYIESNNISIQLDDTVYGGKLDVEKGKLVVDRLGIDLSECTWTWQSTWEAWYTNIIGIKRVTGDIIPNIVSEKYKAQLFGNISQNHYVGIGVSNASDLVIVNDNSTSEEPSGYIVYELASPFTIKLTPHQIDLLKGVNTITTNGTSITLNYRNGEVATLEDLKILSDNLIAHTEDTEPYGFIEHMSILDPAQRIEYIGKNKNYKPVTINLSGDHLANYNDWHDFFVLKENKPYMIKADGTVDYALDPNDYTKKFDGSASDIADTTYTGGAFSWIPKIYKYEYVEGSDRYVYFSQKKLNDNYEAIGFIDENGLEHDGAWIPMFYGTEITQDGTVKIMSLATGAPTQNRNTDTQKTYIENFSSQAKFFGGPIVNVLADLLIMLGKNSDVQAVFGTGNMSGGNGAQYMKDNACINGGAFYGTTTNNVLNKAFHSLVLTTQNQWQRDPYTLNIQGEYVVSPYYKYDLTGDSYVKTGVFVTPPSSNIWVYPHKSVSVPHWGAEPVGPYSGSTTTGWADGRYTLANQLTDTTVRVVQRFGNCDAGRLGGVRCVTLYAAASSAYWHVGASPLLLSKDKTPN